MIPVRPPPPPREPPPGPIPPPPPLPDLGPTQFQVGLLIFSIAVAIARACYVAFNNYQRTHPVSAPPEASERVR